MKKEENTSANPTPEEVQKPVTSNPEVKKKGFFSRNKGVIIFYAIILAAMATLYFWQEYKILKIKNEMETSQIEMEEKARQYLATNTEDLLRLTTTGFGWAIRSELLRGNEEQVELYITQWVQEKRIQQIEIVERDGTIKMSSDKKRQGQAFDESGLEGDPLHAEEVIYQVNPDGNITLYAPLLGLESRMGTLVIHYTPQKFEFAAVGQGE